MHTRACYRVCTPTSEFPGDFWVLAQVEGQLLIETEEGVCITTQAKIDRAVLQGLLHPLPIEA